MKATVIDGILYFERCGQLRAMDCVKRRRFMEPERKCCINCPLMGDETFDMGSEKYILSCCEFDVYSEQKIMSVE